MADNNMNQQNQKSSPTNTKATVGAASNSQQGQNLNKTSPTSTEKSSANRQASDLMVDKGQDYKGSSSSQQTPRSSSTSQQAQTTQQPQQGQRPSELNSDSAMNQSWSHSDARKASSFQGSGEKFAGSKNIDEERHPEEQTVDADQMPKAPKKSDSISRTIV